MTSGLRATIQERVCGTIYTYTFNLFPVGSEFKITIEPEFMRNGSQPFSGYFPRYYKSISSAKGAMTRFFGEPLSWEPVSIQG